MCRGRWPGRPAADPAVRHYSHDAWNSVSSTIKLPAKGAVIGALAPVLTPGEAGERRSFLVAFPILRQSVADRRTANSEWAADLGEELRRKAKVKQRAKSRVRNRQGPRPRRQAGPRQCAHPPVRGVHRHRPQNRPDRRVRAQARRGGAPRRVRADAARPVPRRRVRRLRRPPRRQPHPPRRRMTRPTPGDPKSGPPGAAGLVLVGTSPGCSPTSGTTSRRLPQPVVPAKEPRLFHYASREGAAEPRPRLGGRQSAGVDVADDLRPGAGVVAVHLHPRPAADRGADGHRPALRRHASTPTRTAGCSTTACRSPTPTCSSSANPAAASPPP